MIVEMCLAVAIFFEARNQPIDGQMAVAEVILNRVKDPQWPDSVCDVVNQPKQFSFTHDGLSDDPRRLNEPRAWAIAQIIAQDAIHGINTLGLTSTYFHATYVHPSWHNGLSKDGQIGDHIFYSK
jgi:spore germination cell wall hydrolase CwlJ-like protein